MRKAFKFYRSYFDVAEELNDEDRLAFYDALLKRQFTGLEIDLTGMAKFAYISQKHSIDAQVKGYEDKTNTPLIDPMQGGTQGGIKAPSVQVKEKEKEKDIYIPELSEFLEYAREKVPNINLVAVTLKYDSWIESDWTTNVKGKEHKIKNWKSTLLNTLPYLPKHETQTHRTIID